MPDNEDQIRTRRLRLLTEKIVALSKSRTELTKRLRRERDGDVRRRVDLQRDECIAERALCEARHSALVAGASLGSPGAGAEDALLAAIDKVEDAIAAGAATEALLLAFHGLVVAFPGSTA